MLSCNELIGFGAGEDDLHKFWRIYAVNYGASAVEGLDQMAVMGQGARITEIRMFDSVGDPGVLTNKAVGGTAFSGFFNLQNVHGTADAAYTPNTDVLKSTDAYGDWNAGIAFNGIIPPTEVNTWDAWAVIYNDNDYYNYIAPVFIGYQFLQPVKIKQVTWYAAGAIGANLGFIDYYIQYADNITGPWTNACHATQGIIGCCSNNRSTVIVETGAVTKVLY